MNLVSLDRGAQKQRLPISNSLTAPVVAHWTCLILLAVSGLVWTVPSTARADPILFGVEGTFKDGGTFAGSFLFDPLQPPWLPPDPPTAYVEAFSIRSTPGPVFPGFAYSGDSSSSSAQVAPIGVIQFVFANADHGSLMSQLVIAVPGNSFAAFTGGPIIPLGPNNSSISFEQDWSSGAFRYRTVAAGQISVVPEANPTVLIFLGAVVLSASRVRGQKCAATPHMGRA